MNLGGTQNDSGVVCMYARLLSTIRRADWPRDDSNESPRGVPRGGVEDGFRRRFGPSSERGVWFELHPDRPPSRFRGQHTVYGPAESPDWAAIPPVLEAGSPRSNPGGNVAMSESSGSGTPPDGDLDLSPVWFTEREVAVARLVEAFRTRTGPEYDRVADDAHRLVSLVDEPMTARDARKYRMRFREKVIQAGATLLYAAYGYYDPEELDEVLEEAAETATGLVADERAAIPPTAVIRGQDTCPNCGSAIR